MRLAFFILAVAVAAPAHAEGDQNRTRDSQRQAVCSKDGEVRIAVKGKEQRPQACAKPRAKIIPSVIDPTPQFLL